MKKAFTLIELIVVIAIIAVLAAVITPNVFRAIERANVARAISDADAFKTAGLMYFADTGRYPSTTSDSTPSNNPFLTSAGAGGLSSWDGPYLDSWPTRNSWGHDYIWCNLDAADDNVDDPDCDIWDSSEDYGVRFVQINNVPTTSAERISEQIDGSANGTEGSIRWDTTGWGQVVNVQVLASRDH